MQHTEPSMPAKPLLKASRRVQNRTNTQSWSDPSEITAEPKEDPVQEQTNDATPAAPVEKQPSPWEQYNDKARRYDREMLKEWEENLSILLVFAALFSAVLTTFIISSMPLLQDDDTAAIRGILLTISMQLANSSTAPYQTATFTAPTWSIQVNFLFFASLGCSMAAALAAVLSLQWIRDYDIGLARITIPRERALRRHFRFEGVHLWWMPEIIAVLPILLHVALLLFLGGLVQWLIHIHVTVSVTMIISLVSSGIFYIVTQGCAAIWPSAPFRTPISRILEASGVFIYAKFYLPARNIWVIQVLGRPDPPTSSREPQRVRIPKIITGAPRFREENAIISDKLLSSSALTWLLGHVERSPQSRPYFAEIFKLLVTEEGLSTISQQNLKEKAEWPKIIDWYISELRLTRRADFFYPDEIDEEFFFCSQIATIIGEGTLLGSAQRIAKDIPFCWDTFKTTYVGLSIRLALWKNRSPFQIDSADPPLNLFKGIFRMGSSLTTGVLIGCLQEMKTFMDEGKVSGVELLSCLTILIRESQNEDMSLSWHFDLLDFRMAIYASAIHALCSIYGKVVAATIPEADLDAIAYIFNMYKPADQPGLWPRGALVEADDFYRVLLDVLITLAIHPQMTTAHESLSLISLLAHPTASFVWNGDSAIRPAALFSKFFLFTTPQYRLMPPPDSILDSRFPTIVTAAAHEANLFSMRPLLPGTINWNAFVASLTIVADVCSNSTRTGVDISSQDTQRDPLLLDDPFPWVYSILASIDSEMDNEGFSVAASWLLSWGARRSFDRVLYCPVTSERKERLATLHSPILVIVGCVILGWEYEQYIPADDDPTWDTVGWKIVPLTLLTYFPINRQDSDVALLLAVSRHKGIHFDNMTLGAVIERTHPLDDSSTQSDLINVMQAAMPAFMNLPHITYDRFEEVMDLWEKFSSFFDSFVTAGGLEWLATRRNLDDTHDRHLMDVHDSPTDSPTSVLFRQIGRRNGITSLSSPNCERLLNSAIICDFPNDLWAHSDLLELIMTSFRHLQGFGATSKFEKAGSVCAIILNHGIIEDSCYGSKLLPESHYGEGNATEFEIWRAAVRDLIAGLRGETPNKLVEVAGDGDDPVGDEMCLLVLKGCDEQ